MNFKIKNNIKTYDKKFIFKDSLKFPLNNSSKDFVRSQKLHLMFNNVSNRQK
jgi:hypothetical protein